MACEATNELWHSHGIPFSQSFYFRSHLEICFSPPVPPNIHPSTGPCVGFAPGLKEAQLEAHGQSGDPPNASQLNDVVVADVVECLEFCQEALAIQWH